MMTRLADHPALGNGVLPEHRLLAVRLVLALCGLVFCLQLGGCSAPPAKLGSVVEEDYTRFCSLQNQRASIFRILESSGTIELRRTDEDGTSFDSCALDLWRKGEEFALRLKKFGERFLWVGSDGSDWWVFELAAEPSRLVVLPIDVQGAMNLGVQESLLGPEK